MSYRRGDVRIEDPAGYGGEYSDARSDVRHERPIAVLPHSCDSWVIGGVEEIDALIEDLASARAELARIAALDK